VRLAIKDQLQEIAARGTQIAMPAGLEDKIATNVQRVDDKTFLALSPDDTQEILAGLRPLFSPNGVLTVLVTKSSQVRPFVRRLAQIEFPRLYVMSQDELAASKAELDQTAVEHSAESTAVGASTDE
jgi:type III secretory pathway component EscV